MLSINDFDGFHRAVHGQAAFEWQCRLLARVHNERAWPRVLDLPTGTGKTTCLDIALFALALDATNTPADRWCPRRIAMVVDRRVVVDQVAERGRKLLRALLANDAPSIVVEVARRLRSLSIEGADEGDPVGVYTLRGGIPKDESWARTPDQPLLLASTVDQIGSRLLVQGYGVSPGMKPVHAGLLANDTLVLLDEVHLSQPFAETLEQLTQLRGRFSKVPTRFHCSFLSATPGATNAQDFRLHPDEMLANAPLGKRLHAAKPARRVDASGRSLVEQACVEQALALSKTHAVVAVVVNRVQSAMTVSRQLQESLKDTVDVVVLTGRMRPLDRDDVLKPLRPRILTGRDRDNVERKLILVGTQCIEAGADFDFDAMVTECASLDALRQRFGRLDRLGLYGKAEGVIVVDTDKDAKDDPIYGAALAKTAKWLKDQAKGKAKVVDFGVLALGAILPGVDELAALLAPKEHAPVLMPAYLDLWMQTSPAPTVVPDVALWLHGPKSGPADVQVIWRADIDDKLLTNDDETALNTLIGRVSAVRPSSLESISLPFVAAKAWLEGRGRGDFGDVDGIGLRPEREPHQTRPALVWRGDESFVVDDKAHRLRPGDTIIVPARRGGVRNGCFDPSDSHTVRDLAERASFVGRGLPLLRLNPTVLEQYSASSLSNLEPDERKEKLVALADDAPVGWERAWLSTLAQRAALQAGDDEDNAILRSTKLSIKQLRTAMGAGTDTIENGAEVSTEEDESPHTGRPVSLKEHSSDVERFARAYAVEAGFSAALVDDLALAGWVHDIGKADPRFQLLLRGGDEIALLKDKTPMAKSGMSPGDKTSQRFAQKKSRYPKGTRHEVQSVAMLQAHLDWLSTKAHDVDLVLHLVASHHGYCRPFAPAIDDETPRDVVLEKHASKSFGSVDFAATTSNHMLHRLDAPLAARFWELVETYGWQELCGLEAILRLADHRASEAEQKETP